MVLPVAAPWFTIEEVDEGVLLVTEPHCHRLIRANCFLVRGRERDMLVDSGMGVGSLRAVLAPLLNKPLVVVATHAHVDHIGSHPEFADCERLVHPLEAADLRAPSAPAGLDAAGWFTPDQIEGLRAAGIETAGLLIDAIPQAGYDPSAFRCRGIAPTGLIDEGDRIDLGGRRFEVLHLPGHSPGGVGLWDRDSGTLIGGDTIYDGVLIDTLPGADPVAYRASMERLRTLPVRLVHGGHKPSFGRERMVDIADGYLAREPS